MKNFKLVAVFLAVFLIIVIEFTCPVFICTSATTDTSRADNTTTINKARADKAKVDKNKQVLVTVNGQGIEAEEFIDFYKTRPRLAQWNSEGYPQNTQDNSLKQADSLKPDNSLTPDKSLKNKAKDQNDPQDILDTFVGKVLLVQEAYKLIPQTLNRYQSQVAEAEQRFLINIFSEKEIDQAIKISAEEVTAKVPEERKVRVHLRRIVVADMEEADKIKKELDQGADFASLAKKFSLGEEAPLGGDIGYMSFDQGVFPKPVVEEIFRLKEGQMTGPAKIREGLAIFQLIDKKEADQETIDRARQMISQQLMLERRQEQWDQLFTQLKKDASVMINEALFKEIEQAIAKGEAEKALGRLSSLEVANLKNHAIKLEEIIPENPEISFGQARPWEKDTAFLRRLLERHIRLTLVSDYARQLNYDKSGEVKKNVSRFKDDLMARELIAEKVYKGLSVSKEEAKEYYQSRLSEYKRQERVQIDLITVQDETRAKDLWQQLKQGSDFNKLSEKSKSPVLVPKVFFARGESGMGESFEKVVFDLQPGQISEVIKTPKGFHIIKILDRQKEGVIEFDQVENDLREKLLLTKRESSLTNYIASLRQKSQVTINKPLFKEIIDNAL